MEKIKQVREFFWPILEKAESKNEPIKDIEIQIESQDILKVIYDKALKRLEAEEDRKKVVENKSTIFIGTIGIITSIIIGVTSTLIKEAKIEGFMMVMVVLLFVLTIYMLRTVWFAIKALERKAYHNISISDLCSIDEKEFYKNSIQKINATLLKNYPTTNSKVDNMTMAQEYFKRGIVVLGLFGVTILFFFIYRFGFWSWFKSKFELKLKVAISISNEVILYFICLLLSISVTIMFIKLRRLNSVVKKKK